ncbi:MAG: hypothetical protein QUU85_19185, partial [Candidatus Eisenbacteria bacterium]|nr:hypothetical protein [Candidatus Eisenbacteria bacterium]
MPERAASAHDPLHDSLPIARTRETGRRSSWRLALLVLAGAVAVSVGWAAAPRSAAAAPAWSAPASPSTDCADYEDYLQWRWTGGVDTPGLAWDVAAYGQYAYVADHSEGMQVLDISDPQHPTIVRQVSLQIVTLGVAVSGEYLYLVGHEPGFVVMSLTDPANPALVGQAETPHSCHGIDVAGDHAYIAVDWDTESLLILDISTKTNPRIVASLGAASSANDVTVSGGYAYLACIETGLAVIDVGDPENPELVTTVDTRVDPELPVAAYGIVVSGSLAYVADYSGLVVIDVTDPQAPGIVGRLTIPSHGGHSVALSGDRAFVSGYEYPGVMIADVTDPANPAVEEMLKIRGRPSGIALAGSALLVSDDALGVQVVEMTNPDAEDPIEALGQVALAGDVLDLAEAGGVAYAADASSFSSVDVTNPQSPVVLDSWTPMRYVMAIEVVGDRAYVADGDVLTVLDVSDPGNLELLGRSAETYWDMTDVAVSGSYVYATLEPHGWVYVFDVSDPSQPGIVGDVQVGYEPRSIAVSGSYAFVAEHTTRLVNLDVVDISDPRAPQLVAVLPLGTQTTSDAKVAVQRTRAYVAAASGFYIADVSSPRRPRLVGTGDRPYGYGSISILGNRAALGFAGFDVADMSDPENPRVIGGRSLSSGSDEVLLTNDYIFASQRTEDGSLLQLYPAACDPTPPLPITPFNLLVPVSEDSFLTTEPLMRWESAHAADPADSVRY